MESLRLVGGDSEIVAQRIDDNHYSFIEGLRMPATSFDCSCAFEGGGERNWRFGAGGLFLEDEAGEEEAPREEVEAACVDESILLLAQFPLFLYR